MKKDMKKDIKQACEYLIPKLKDKGFVVHLYSSQTTNSAYLKLDYGIANSIRISNHKGKRYLDYRYNVECWRKEKADGITKRGYKRYYYPSEEEWLDRLVDAAVSYRDKKKERYGEERYQKYMQANIEKSKVAKERTFWEGARQV